MDFGTLKSRILGVIGRAPADICYELVTADINQEMRLRVMASTTTLAESATVTLPADFLELISIYRDVTPRTTLSPEPPQLLHRGHQSSGTPVHYSVEDGQLRLSPAPSGTANLVIRYYASLADLSADGDENDVLTKYPSIYTYGVLAHHAALIKDQDGIGLWFPAYEKAKQQARADDQKYRNGGFPITPRATVA